MARLFKFVYVMNLLLFLSFVVVKGDGDGENYKCKGDGDCPHSWHKLYLYKCIALKCIKVKNWF
ncbi:unnamed protein product [Lathyrus oleraceus]